MDGSTIVEKLYKDKNGNIYSVSPIQTPKREWVELTKKETEAHLNPVPTVEQLASSARHERDKALKALDEVVSNPLRFSELLEEQRLEVASYRKLLLGVPQQKGFPTAYEMPKAPSWLT